MSMKKPTAEELKARRKAWAEALRSRKYRQGEKRLCRIGKSGEQEFCCLGVACEVAIEMGLHVTKAVEGLGVLYDNYNTANLPTSVKKFFGLCSDMGTTKRESLFGMNDDGVPFSQIADFIESNPPGLWDEDSEAK